MKKRFGVIATIVAAASFFSLITASVAWFEARTDVDFGTGHGSTAASYFESGAGTSDSPFIISNSTHLYNLAWLQYLGRFNTRVSSIYFKLKNNIDMSSFPGALPPIGTQKYPFMGIFEGNNKVISNLTVSNDINDMVKKPTSINEIEGCEVIGFFGIVGDPIEIGITKEDGLNYGSLDIVNKLRLSSFYLENASIKSNTNNTLIGVVAGYVNGAHGTVHDIGVLNGALHTKSGAQPIAHFSDDGILSKFSLVGETEDTVWQQAYEDGAGGGQGQDSSFGGSVNMWDVNRRVSYILKEDYDYDNSSATYYKTYNSTSRDTYGAYFQVITTTGPFCVSSVGSESGKAGTAYLRSGALPINVNTETMFGGTETYSTSNKSNTKTVTNTYYSTNHSEVVAANNSGYFTGVEQYGTAATSTNVVFGSKGKEIIDNSYTTVGGDLTLYSMKPTDTAFSAINTGHLSSTKTINLKSGTQTLNTHPVDYYGYSNFQRVCTDILPTLNNTINQGYINGFRLSANVSNTSASNSFTIANASLFGSSVTNYPVMKRGLNFSLRENGTITLIITGTEQNSTGNTGMFRLFGVQRSGNSITSTTEIRKVYKTASGTITYNSGSDSDLVYDQSKWDDKLAWHCLYYCEIPVTAGDYWLCGSSIAASGYLVYLDIGSNGGGGGGSSTTGDYDLKNVRYIHSLSETTIAGSNYIDILFEITTAAGATGTVAIYFARQSPALLYYHKTNNVNLRVFIATATNIEESTSAIWDA